MVGEGQAAQAKGLVQRESAHHQGRESGDIGGKGDVGLSMLNHLHRASGYIQQEGAVVALDKVVIHLEGQHKGTADRGLTAALHAEVGRHIEDTGHVAHCAAGHLMDAAVVCAVLACVRVVEQHGQAEVGGEDTHPLDLIHLGGEKGHELPQRIQILIHHLGHEQIVVHVGVVVHRHEIEGEVAGEPAVPAADHHVGHVEDPVGVHIVVDRGTVGTRRIGAVEVQNLLPVLRPGIGQPGLVAVGADRGGLGLVEIVLVAVTVSHVGIERGIEGVETADRRPLFGVIPHQHLQERAGHPLFLVKKVCGDIGCGPHRHHHTSDVEGEIHHQDGAQQGSIVVKTAEVTALVRTVQFAFHVLEQGGRRLGGE